MNLLQNTTPLPTRCWTGMFQRHPASCAKHAVYGFAGSSTTVWNATAESQGSQ
jgi:hypothetical protein